VPVQYCQGGVGEVITGLGHVPLAPGGSYAGAHCMYTWNWVPWVLHISGLLTIVRMVHSGWVWAGVICGGCSVLLHFAGCIRAIWVGGGGRFCHNAEVAGGIVCRSCGASWTAWGDWS
jgi:hypothetical protein